MNLTASPRTFDASATSDTGGAPDIRTHELTRPMRDRMLVGVAAGIADYLDLDPTVVRIILAVLAVVGGVGIPLYLAGWLLIPEEGAEKSIAADLVAFAPVAVTVMTDGSVRISDADRTAVADRLAQHYADGRLDRVEFDERLERALAAKTVADLDGLFTGLPGGSGADTRTPAARTPTDLRIRSRPGSHRARWLLLVVLVTAAVGHELARAVALWPLVVVAVLLWVRHQRRDHRPL